MLKKTPLCQRHEQLGGRMVDFAGWFMPVQYKGLREEHLCVRQNVGLFDVSHMGEIRVRGPQSLETLQWLTTNDVSLLNDGDAQYALLPNDSGGLVDDIFIYCLKKQTDYLVCVNASNSDKDFAWMLKNNKGAQITNESEQWGQIAIQGPKALALCDLVLKSKVSEFGHHKIRELSFQGHNCLVATTGYTGEKGCEIFVPAKQTQLLWDAFLEVGQSFGAQPIGLGARDTLRTEMKYSLYGHEIDDTTNPYEATLGWAIKPNAKDFLGRSAILSAKELGLKRKLVGFKMLDKGIPRQGYTLHSIEGHEIGFVTSGTHSPTLDAPIGIGYLKTDHANIGLDFLVDIRGRKVKAQVCKTPFITQA
jgi:aminomethyltransferase